MPSQTLERRYDFDPLAHAEQLVPLIHALGRLPGDQVNDKAIHRLLKRFPKAGCGFFTRSDMIAGYRALAETERWPLDEQAFIERVRLRPVRTLSGVTPVTVLTKPFPCPGRCIFCPNDVRMPKSYLSSEPGAQRAAQNDFDPYLQTYTRMLAYHRIGHPVDKIELIVLGGTWSYYPEPFQVWFITRCFDAMNDFGRDIDGRNEAQTVEFDFADIPAHIDGTQIDRTYNQIIRSHLEEQHGRELLGEWEHGSWEQLYAAHRDNEISRCRNVGLVLETRPDHISQQEVLRLRRLGATKVQIGYQSLSDEVLEANKRGHDVAATRRAMVLLRGMGFKIHAHWMANLYGSSPALDVEDFGRLFTDPAFRPDELKLYPCSLVETAELMSYYQRGEWHPYTREELLDVLTQCIHQVPEYCRLTRIIRDIPSQDILVGNKLTNFREVVEAELQRLERPSRDIRQREIRGRPFDPKQLELQTLEYESTVGREQFISLVTPDDLLVGFLRLSLPSEDSPIPELHGAALLREVHIYGSVVSIGERHDKKAQHLGLGTKLVREAERRAAAAGYEDLAVISAIGTRVYYRRLGFTDGELYQHLAITGPSGCDDSGDTR